MDTLILQVGYPLYIPYISAICALYMSNIFIEKIVGAGKRNVKKEIKEVVLFRKFYAPLRIHIINLNSIEQPCLTRVFNIRGNCASFPLSNCPILHHATLPGHHTF